MHIDDTIIDRYLSRSFERGRQLDLDEHVNTCLACRLAVEAAGLDPDRWERRGVLARLGRAA
jgi:hypothetical protein